MADRNPLEMTGEAFHLLGSEVLKYLTKYVESLSEIPVTVPAEDPDLSALAGPLPRATCTPEKLLKDIFQKAVEGGHQFHSPGYQCYIPTGGLLEPSLAELIVSTLNRFTGYREWSPGFNEIERTVVSWLVEMLELPSTYSGILTSGGSLANFTAMHTARFHKVPEDCLSRATIYCSNQAHHSILRAGMMIGLRRANIRMIEVDHNYRVDSRLLEQAIIEDKSAGLHPFMLVGMGGTTGSGAVDNLTELQSLASKHGLWFHVDAAWAGGFRLLKQTSKLFAGIEKADSVTFDPHKALFLPMGCGSLLVRDWKLLEAAHSVEVTYLPDDQHAAEYNPSKGGLELLRPSRGLQLWLPLKLHGIGPFVDCHQEKMDLTTYTFNELKKIPGIEFLHEPQVAMIVFRLADKGVPTSDLDDINKHLIELVNDAHTKISGAQFKTGFWARIVPFGLRTHQSHVDRTLERVHTAIAELRSR